MSRNELRWQTTSTAGVPPKVVSADVGCWKCGWGATWDPESEPWETFQDTANRHVDTQHPAAPHLGATVHYRSYGTPGGEYTPECRASIVTYVGITGDPPATRDAVTLAVFNPDGIFLKANIPHDPVHKSGGTWHWPCT